jgi:hypothetical protein
MGGAKDLVLELAGQFSDNGKPNLLTSVFSNISFDFYKNCLYTSNLGKKWVEKCSAGRMEYI